MQINVTSNFKELAKEFDPVIVDKASVAAVNKLATQSRTFLSKEIRQRYTVKAGDLNKQSRVIRATPKRIISTIISRGKRIALAKFKSRQSGRGTAVTVIRGRRKMLTGAFKQTMKSGHTGVYFRRREGGKRVPKLPIDEIFGPSYPQMLRSIEVLKKLNNFVASKVQPLFSNAIDFYYNKIGGLQ